jgi:hypothetical protein
MKLLIFLTFVLASSFVMAAIDLGVYEGKNLKGEDCLVGVKSVEYLGQIKHALNERVEIIVTFSESTFTSVHQPKIDLFLGEVTTDKSLLSMAVATSLGVEAVEMNVLHSADANVPTKLAYLFIPKSDSQLMPINDSCTELKKR